MLRPLKDRKSAKVRRLLSWQESGFGKRIAIGFSALVFALGSVVVLLPPAKATAIKLVQAGTVTMSTATTTSTVTLGTTLTDTAKSFLIFSSTVNSNNAAAQIIDGRITNATTLTFERDATGTVSASIKWQVAEFNTGVAVQRGTTTSFATSQNITITSVDLTKSFPIITMEAGGATLASDDMFRPALTTSTNLQITGGTSNANGRQISWQVVEYQGATVQTGTVAFNGTDTTKTATVTSVNTAKSWLMLYAQTSDNTSTNIATRMFQGDVTNSTTLTFDRDSSNGTITATVGYHLVEFTDGTSVQKRTLAYGLTDTQIDETITSVATARSVVAAGGFYLSGGRTAYTADDIVGSGGATTMELTSSTNLQTIRALASSALAVTIAYVVEFAQADLDQEEYRWYANADSVQPGAALANANTAHTLANNTTPVRLRLSLEVTAGALAATSQTFDLQYATSTSGPWTDVGTTWLFYNNPTPADGATITTALLPNSTVSETYEENNPTASNPNAVAEANIAEWDFALDPTSVAASTTYYFRMAYTDGTAINSYFRYPQVTTAAAGGGAPTTEERLRGGGSFQGGVRQPFSL